MFVCLIVSSKTKTQNRKLGNNESMFGFVIIFFLLWKYENCICSIQESVHSLQLYSIVCAPEAIPIGCPS